MKRNLIKAARHGRAILISYAFGDCDGARVYGWRSTQAFDSGEGCKTPSFFSRALSERNLAPGRHVGPLTAGRQHGVALPVELGAPLAAQTGTSQVHQPAIPAPEETLQDALAAASGIHNGLRARIRPFLKRSIDIAGSAAGLILLSPCLLVLPLASNCRAQAR
ncbi:hypothetical protein V6L77_18520 [Pannonibacter sp. Pt2-lr]